MRGADPDRDPGPGELRELNFSPIKLRTGVSACKSGSVETSGTFIAAIKARSQSIG